MEEVEKLRCDETQEKWREFFLDTKEEATNLSASVGLDVLRNNPTCVERGRVFRELLEVGWLEGRNELNDEGGAANKHCGGSLQQILDNTEALSDAEFVKKGGVFLCDLILNGDSRSECGLPGGDPLHEEWSPVTLGRMSYITQGDDHDRGEEKEGGAGGASDNNQHMQLGCNYFR